MGSIINYASQRGTSVFTELRFVLLPKGSRVPTSYTVTVGTATTALAVTTGASATSVGATTITTTALATAIPGFSKIRFANGVEVRVAAGGAAAAATSITLLYPTIREIPGSTTGSVAASLLTVGSEYLPVTALPTNIYPGEKLTFNVAGTAYSAVVSDFAPAGAIQLQVQPLTVVATAGHVASTLATLYIAGATDASPSSQPKTVDGSNFQSGAGSEMITTGTSRTMSFTFQRIVGDVGADLLMQMLYNDEFYDREIYATLKRPFGEEYAGAAIMTSGNQSSPVQDLITVQADLQFQGSSFVYKAPTGGFNPGTGSYTPPTGA